MSETVMMLMIGVSTFLGALGLIGLLWAVKTGQFDDQSKFLDAARYDNEEDLRDAQIMDEKQKARDEGRKSKEKGYAPPD